MMKQEFDLTFLLTILYTAGKNWTSLAFLHTSITLHMWLIFVFLYEVSVNYTLSTEGKNWTSLSFLYTSIILHM